MTIIDERILIPTAPEAVWDILSNISDNPRWQADCQSVSFLTSLRIGPGVRWRYTSANGQESVVEITAWYDGLGYEYTFIDGAPFRNSKGTIRLQEIAEGTIVQWTLNYETGGVLAGLRNAVTIRRHYDAVMIESLKALWTFMKDSGRARQSHEARSLMREALDYEARAQYKPRHPSRVADSGEEPELALILDEPPVSDEDTRPNPTLAAEPVESTGEAVSEESPAAPRVVDDEWETPSVSPDIARFQRPSVPESASPDSEAPVVAEPEASASITSQDDLPAETVESTLSAATTSPSSLLEAQEIEPVVLEPRDVGADAEAEKSTAEPMENLPLPSGGRPEDVPLPAEEFGPKLDTAKLDTREVSIWEVFGVPRPSETRPMRPISDEEMAEVAVDEGPAEAPVALEAARKVVKPIATPEPAPEVTSPPAQAEPSPSPVIETRVVLPGSVPVMSEDTRPNVILPAARESVVTIFIPGFRLRARRSLVRLRRRL
ncbi:MAG: SRPBCC family protein [Anaerolineae bacterium]|nr:SRPBCC family protein [Anaerolineae bacterium]